MRGDYQVTLLPECLDDYIGQDNPVRIVDEREAAHEQWLKHQEEQKRIHDIVDVALEGLLATSSGLWAVVKSRVVSDDYETYEFEIPLAVFESESEANAAIGTIAEARLHHDSDEFSVKPMPLFKTGGAA